MKLYLIHLLLLFSFNLFSQIALPTFYGALRVSNQNQFQGTSATFTNCGKTGKFGPSQGECNSEYSGTNLDGFVTVSAGIQEWEVPVTGTYIITAYGAQGGGLSGGSDSGGKGAKISGEFNLTAGTVLKILVGQKGLTVNKEASGGGGTFVTKSPHNNNASILVVAGGGGGSWNNHTTSHGQAGESGNAGCCGTSKGQGGSNGNGGGGQGTCASDGGAGFFTNNNVLTHCGNGAEREAFAYVNGGRGGQNYWCSGAVGGFGGGGGTARCAGNTYTGGGGGGYSGGGMDYPYQNGTPGGAGGAGSKNNGSNATNVSGNNPGHGKVEISW